MTKAKFIIYKSEACNESDKIKEFEVLFNPNEYKISSSRSIQSKGQIENKDGNNSDKVNTSKNVSQTLNLELFFDTYEDGISVVSYTDDFYDAIFNAEDEYSHRGCVFTWGDFLFKGLVSSINMSFIMFLESGIPVRAKVSLTLNLSTDKRPAKPKDDGSSAKNKKDSELKKLYEKATQNYKGMDDWKSMAEKCKIDNPRLIGIK